MDLIDRQTYRQIDRGKNYNCEPLDQIADIPLLRVLLHPHTIDKYLIFDCTAKTEPVSIKILNNSHVMSLKLSAVCFTSNTLGPFTYFFQQEQYAESAELMPSHHSTFISKSNKISHICQSPHMLNLELWLHHFSISTTTIYSAALCLSNVSVWCNMHNTYVMSQAGAISD